MTLPYTNTGDLTKVRFTCEDCRYPEGKGCGHVWIADADEHYVENHPYSYYAAPCPKCGKTNKEAA